MYDSYFTEILVQSYKDTAFTVGVCKDLLITWIFRPVTGPYNIMTKSLKIFPRTTPNAGI
jgi:hypothetical protein